MLLNARVGRVLLVSFCRVTMLAILSGASLASRTARADEPQVCIDQHAAAQELRMADQLIEARRALATCLSQASCPEVIRAECDAMLKEVEAAIPSLVFAARDASGKDALHVSVYRDDQLMLRELGVDDVELDPGRYRFRFVARDGSTQEEDVVVRVGEKNRLVLADFRPEEAGNAQSAQASSHAQQGSGGGRAIGYGLLATGVVAAGVGTYFGLRAQQKDDESGGYCDGNNRCSDRGLELRDEAITSATAATVSFAAALISGSVGAYLLLGSSSETPRETTLSRVTPVASGDFFGAAMSGKF